MPWTDSDTVPSWGQQDFPLEIKPSVSSTSITTTATTTTPTMIPSSPSAEHHPAPAEKQPRLTLLTLPLEIRLQIYHHVHASHAVSPPQLAPWLPNPAYSAYMLRAVRPNFLVRTLQDPYPAETAAVAADVSSPSSPPPLLSARRPVSRVPSALLRASRQVYAEARLVPFARNEFVFVTAFCSGVAAAAAFSAGLQPWQRDALRYARVEMREPDLCAPEGQWARLCSLWALGLRGLRLRVVFNARPREGERKEEAEEAAEEAARRERNCRALGDGLRLMRALRQVEVHLDQDGWTDEEKILWCRTLADVVNLGKPRPGDHVRVVCVERSSERAEFEEVCRPGKAA